MAKKVNENGNNSENHELMVALEHEIAQAKIRDEQYERDQKNYTDEEFEEMEKELFKPSVIIDPKMSPEEKHEIMESHKERHEAVSNRRKEKLGDARYHDGNVSFVDSNFKIFMDSSSPGTGKTVSDILNTLHSVVKGWKKYDNLIASSVFANANIKQILDNAANRRICKELRKINGEKASQAENKNGWPILIFHNPSNQDLLRLNFVSCTVINKFQIARKDRTYSLEQKSVLDFILKNFKAEFEALTDYPKDSNGSQKISGFENFCEKLHRNEGILNKISNENEDDDDISSSSSRNQGIFSDLEKQKDGICSAIFYHKNGIFRSNSAITDLAPVNLTKDDLGIFNDAYCDLFLQYVKVFNDALSFIYYNDDIFIDPSNDTNSDGSSIKMVDKLDDKLKKELKENNVHFVLFLILFQPSIFAQFTSSIFMMTHKKLVASGCFKFINHNPDNKDIDATKDYFRPTIAKTSICEFGSGYDFLRNLDNITYLSSIGDDQEAAATKLTGLTKQDESLHYESSMVVNSRKKSIYPNVHSNFVVAHKISIDEYPTFERDVLHKDNLHISLLSSKDNINDLAFTLGKIVDEYGQVDNEEAKRYLEKKTHRVEQILHTKLPLETLHQIKEIVRTHIKSSLMVFYGEEQDTEDDTKRIEEFANTVMNFFRSGHSKGQPLSLGAFEEKPYYEGDTPKTRRILNSTMSIDNGSYDGETQGNNPFSSVIEVIKRAVEHSITPFSTTVRMDSMLYLVTSKRRTKKLSSSDIYPTIMKKTDLLNMITREKDRRAISCNFPAEIHCKYSLKNYMYDDTSSCENDAAYEEEEKHELIAIPFSYYMVALTATPFLACHIVECVSNGMKSDASKNTILPESLLKSEVPSSRRYLNAGHYSIDDTIYSLSKDYETKATNGYISQVLKYVFTSEKFQNENSRVQYLQSHVISKMIMRFKVAELSKNRKSEKGFLVNHFSLEASIRVSSAPFFMWYLMNMPTLKLSLLSATMNMNNSRLGEIFNDLVRLEKMSGEDPTSTITFPEKERFFEINRGLNNIRRLSHSIPGVTCEEKIAGFNVITTHGAFKGTDYPKKSLYADGCAKIFDNSFALFSNVYKIEKHPKINFDTNNFNIVEKDFLNSSVSNVSDAYNATRRGSLSWFEKKTTKDGILENIPNNYGLPFYTKESLEDQGLDIDDFLKNEIFKGGLFNQDGATDVHEDDTSKRLNEIIFHLNSGRGHLSKNRADEIINQCFNVLSSAADGKHTLSFSRRNDAAQFIVVRMYIILYRCKKKNNPDEIKNKREFYEKKHKESPNSAKFSRNLRIFKALEKLIDLNEQFLEDTKKIRDEGKTELAKRRSRLSIQVPLELIFEEADTNLRKPYVSRFKGDIPSKKMTLSEMYPDGMLLACFISSDAKHMDTENDLFRKSYKNRCLVYVMTAYKSGGEGYNIPLITFYDPLVGEGPVMLDSDFDRCVLLCDVYYSQVNEIVDRNKRRHLYKPSGPEGNVSMNDAVVSTDLSMRIAADFDLNWDSLLGAPDEEIIEESISHEHYVQQNKTIAQVAGRMDRKFRNNDLEIFICSNSYNSKYFTEVLYEQLMYVKSEIGFDGSLVIDSNNAQSLSVVRTAILTAACYHYREIISDKNSEGESEENASDKLQESYNSHLRIVSLLYGDNSLYRDFQRWSRHGKNDDEDNAEGDIGYKILASELRGDHILENENLITSKSSFWNLLLGRFLMLKSLKDKDHYLLKTVKSDDIDKVIEAFTTAIETSKVIFDEKYKDNDLFMWHDKNKSPIISRLPEGMSSVKYIDKAKEYCGEYKMLIPGTNKNRFNVFEKIFGHSSGNEHVSYIENLYTEDALNIIKGHLGEYLFKLVNINNTNKDDFMKKYGWSPLYDKTIKVDNPIHKGETNIWTGGYFYKNGEENVDFVPKRVNLAYEQADFFFVNKSQNRVIAIDVKNFSDPNNALNLLSKKSDYEDDDVKEKNINERIKRKESAIKSAFESEFDSELKVDLYIVNVNPKRSCCGVVNGPLSSLWDIDNDSKIIISKWFKDLFNVDFEKELIDNNYESDEEQEE